MSPEDGQVILVEDLHKRYGELEAVRGVNLKVRRGETFRFLGPNGAGKSTTISCLHPGAAVIGARARRGVRRGAAPERRPQAHRARLPGHHPGRLPDSRGESPAARGAVRRSPIRDPRPHGPGPRHGRSEGAASRRRPNVLGRDEASPGDRQGAAAFPARALPGRADDRPRSADPRAHLELPERAQAARGHHDVPHHPLHGRSRVLRPHCDHRSRHDHRGGDTRIPKDSVGKERVTLRTDDDEAAARALQERFGLTATSGVDGLTVHADRGEELVPQLVRGLGVGVRSVQMSRPSLDDVFMFHTGRTIRDAEASSGEMLRSNPFMRRRR